MTLYRDKDSGEIVRAGRLWLNKPAPHGIVQTDSAFALDGKPVPIKPGDYVLTPDVGPRYWMRAADFEARFKLASRYAGQVH